MEKPFVSIIIRTKNEERWITSCLKSVSRQSYKNFEIIIVDNHSSDKTIEKARQHNIKKIISIKKYFPGKALNLGIKKSKGKYVVCLSAHCIPVSRDWLSFLVKAIEEEDKYAGVYGRQEPMSFSSPSDKRDMHLVFGLDRKVQVKDSFFHNANSIIRRNLWKKFPFDNRITNIEDRVWAQKVLNKGYKILYEPEASVYHFHGIHQDGNVERLKNVVNIIEKKSTNYKSGKLDAKKMKIIALIPVKGKSKLINNKYQLYYTIKAAKKSQYIDEIFVSTDSKETAKIARKAGALCPFLRPKYLSNPSISLEEVQKYSLKKIENLGILPDLVIHLEETFPFRPQRMIDGMISHFLEDGYDTVIAARREVGWLWHEKTKGRFERIDSGDIPREFKEKSLVGLHGLGCVIYPEFLRKGRLVGENTGLYEISHPLAGLEIREHTKHNLKFASKLLKNFKL